VIVYYFLFFDVTVTSLIYSLSLHDALPISIIRLCDWFGVRELLCSPDTVDCFNPKVVQASMGSISRVNVNYTDLEKIINANPKTEVFGTFMNGEDVYSSSLPENGILVLGNEANGISSQIENLVSRRIGIPQFGAGSKTESLNVATATAILLSEFR